MATKAQSITLGWKDQLNRHRYHSVLATRTDDFSIFKNLAAQNPVDNIDHGAMLQRATDDSRTIIAKLTQLNVDICKDAEAAMKSFTDVIVSKKDKVMTEELWNALLETQTITTKDRMVAKVKEVTLEAIDYIVTLHDESQRPAANFFYHQAVIAMKPPETVNKHVALFFGHIVEFLNKNFRYIQYALDEVMYDIEAIIDELKDPLLLSSPMVQQAGHLVKFVGRCNWPASVSFSVATAGTSNLVHTLAQNGIKLEKKSVTRDEDSGTIESCINLEIPSNSDGASLFKRAVDGLGNDGHFIPNAPIAAF